MTTTKSTQYVTLDEAWELNKIMKNIHLDRFQDDLTGMLKALYELNYPGCAIQVTSMGSDFCYEVKLELEEERA